MAKLLVVILLISMKAFADWQIAMEHICFMNRCYLFRRIKKTWDDAQIDCENNAAKLVVFHEYATVWKIFKYIDDEDDGFWIGGRRGTDTALQLQNMKNVHFEKSSGFCIQLTNKPKLSLYSCCMESTCRWTLENQPTAVQTYCTQRAYYICEKVVRITEESKDSKSQIPENRKDNSENNQNNGGLGDGAVVGIVFIISFTIIAAIVVVGLLIRRNKSRNSFIRLLDPKQPDATNPPALEANHVDSSLSSANAHSSDSGCSVDPIQSVDGRHVNSDKPRDINVSYQSQSSNNQSDGNSRYQSIGDLTNPVENSKMVF